MPSIGSYSAKILREVRVDKVHRAFEATEIIDAFTQLERRLASPKGDTHASPPVRAVPKRLPQAADDKPRPLGAGRRGRRTQTVLGGGPRRSDAPQGASSRLPRLRNSPPTPAPRPSASNSVGARIESASGPALG